MKIMKKSLFALALVSMTASVLPYHGHGGYYGGGGDFGGGFATGAILGTGLTLAATSGSRNSENPDTVTIKSINREIERENKEIRKLRADLRKGRISKEEYDDSVAEHKDNIESLQKQRAQVRA